MIPYKVNSAYYSTFSWFSYKHVSLGFRLVELLVKPFIVTFNCYMNLLKLGKLLIIHSYRVAKSQRCYSVSELNFVGVDLFCCCTYSSKSITGATVPLLLHWSYRPCIPPISLKNSRNFKYNFKF